MSKTWKRRSLKSFKVLIFENATANFLFYGIEIRYLCIGSNQDLMHAKNLPHSKIEKFDARCYFTSKCKISPRVIYFCSGII